MSVPRALGSSIGFAVLGSILVAALTATLSAHLAGALPDPTEREEVATTIIRNANPRAYFNTWRPHRGLGQRAPCGSAPTDPSNPTGRIIGQPVLGGLHHVYQHPAWWSDGVVRPTTAMRLTS
jgi:hypothetical protein